MSTSNYIKSFVRSPNATLNINKQTLIPGSNINKQTLIPGSIDMAL